MNSFYPVVCAETFIGEDAADAIRVFDPGADVRVFRTMAEAATEISMRDSVMAAFIIGPREPIGPSTFAAQLCALDRPLLILSASLAVAIDVPCTVLHAELPFTNETIHNLLRRVASMA